MIKVNLGIKWSELLIYVLFYMSSTKMTNSSRFYRITNYNGGQDGDQKSGDVTGLQHR